jgi:hypothetical protein
MAAERTHTQFSKRKVHIVADDEDDAMRRTGEPERFMNVSGLTKTTSCAASTACSAPSFLFHAAIP